MIPLVPAYRRLSRKPQSPNTPGIVGYAAGVGVSDLVCAPLLMAPALVEAHGLGDVLSSIVFLPIAAVLVAVYGAPVAVIGAVLVDRVCSRVKDQKVHVAVAAIAGILTTLWYAHVTDLGGLGPNPASVAVAVGCAAAIGRAAVIPLVRSRRRLASPPPLRVP